MENPNVGIFRSFPLGYIDVLEKPSSLPLGGVDLEFSLAAPGGRGLGWGLSLYSGFSVPSVWSLNAPVFTRVPMAQ